MNINKFPCYKIEINSENEFDDKCQEFIKKLEYEYQKYIKNRNSKINNYKQIKNNNFNLFVDIEETNYLSPITVLNGSWGIGKTYFIETICKKFYNDELKTKVINGIILLDSWKYSITDNPAYLILLELISKISNIFQTISKKSVNILKIIGEQLTNIVDSKVGTNLSKYFDQNNNNLYTLLDKKIDELNNINNKTILIIIDNIERLGNEAWKIIKMLYVLSKINNFIILLPMNINMLSDNYSSNPTLYTEKCAIIKYLKMPIFNFNQDYLPILSKYFTNTNIIDYFNKILNNEINGEKLSIRTLEQYLKKIDINKIEKSFLKNIKYFQEIWHPIDTYKNIVKNIIEIYKDKIFTIQDDYFQLLDAMNEDWSIIDVINLFDNNIEFEKLDKSEIFSDLNYFLNNINYIETIINKLPNILKLAKERKDQLQSEINYNNDQINKLKDEVTKIQNKIHELNDYIKKYESKEIEHFNENNSQYNLNLSEINVQYNAKHEHENNIQTLNSKNKDIQEQINYLNIILNNEAKILFEEWKNKFNSLQQSWNDLHELEDFKYILNIIIDNNIIDNRNVYNEESIEIKILDKILN